MGHCIICQHTVLFFHLYISHHTNWYLVLLDFDKVVSQISLIETNIRLSHRKGINLLFFEAKNKNILTQLSAFKSSGFEQHKGCILNDVLGVSVVGSRALLESWVSLCHLCAFWRSTGFSGESFRSGGRERARGSSNSMMQHRWPLLSSRVYLQVSRRAGQAQIR